MPSNTREKKINYLFRMPESYITLPKEVITKVFKQLYQIDFSNMQMDLMGETLVVLFKYSATLYVAKNNQAIREIKIWPKDALKDNKKTILAKQNGKLARHNSLFNLMFRDGDNSNNVYLQYGINKEKGLNCLYKVSLEGKLLGVMYIEEGEDFASFRLKQNGLYYAKEDDKISIYKEVSK